MSFSQHLPIQNHKTASGNQSWKIESRYKHTPNDERGAEKIEQQHKTLAAKPQYLKEALTPELAVTQIQQLDEIVASVNDAVWASFVPLFAVGDSALLEQKVEESFSLYLRFIDKQIAGRKNKIPRITWRHWYSTKRDEYGFLHFHILYLLDGTGISTDQMEIIHEQALAEIERLDNGKKLEDIRIALENKELRKWASKAGQNYKPAKHYKHKPVINKDASVAMKSNDNNKCVGYGSKAHKLKRNHDGKVFEIYSTTPSHTALTIR